MPSLRSFATPSRVLCAAGAMWLASPAFAETAPVTSFQLSALADVRVNSSQALWGTRFVAVDPDIRIDSLFECITTVKSVWNFENLCTGDPMHLVCEETQCFLGVIPISPPTYSEDCFYCIDHPECCDAGWEDLGDPPVYDDEGALMISLPQQQPAQLNLDRTHVIASPLETLGLAGRPHVLSEASKGILFTRPPGVPSNAPATLSLPITVPNIALSTGDGEATIAFSRYEFVLSSPQLGQLFRSAVRQPKDGAAIIEGDVPASAFQLADGSTLLTGYQHPTINVAIPPGVNVVRLDVQLTMEAAADWDRNGNDVADRIDIAQGVSADDDADGVPDEVQRFDLLHHAVGDALLSGGQDGEMLVSNIGASGQDGVSVALAQALGYAARFADMPLPGGGWFFRIQLAPAPSNPGSLVSCGLSPTQDGRVGIGVDLSAIGTPTVSVAILDGTILRALHQSLEANAEEVLAKAEQLADDFCGSTGPWFPPGGPWPDPRPGPLPQELEQLIGDGMLVMQLRWQQPVQLEIINSIGPAASVPVVGDRLVIIAEQQSAPIDGFDRAVIRAAGVGSFELISEITATEPPVTPRRHEL
ncbi:hypothetical protein RAS1_05000 [Phycisphaerae bacterium RAS1]|nr:hypothetical protein RAS1_05000 [Phycisphaerae bacterium RAS1]